MKKIVGIISLIVFFLINFIFLQGKLIVGTVLDKSTAVALGINMLIGAANMLINAYCKGE